MAALYLAESRLAFLIHELGHAAAALFIGRRTHIIAVLPISFLVKQKKFVFKNPIGTRDIGGFVFATPPVGGDWRRGEWIFILGGIAANAISSLVAFLLAESGNLGTSFQAAVGTFGLLSLVIAVINLVPIWGPRRLRSDGAHLIDILLGRVDRASERLAWLAAMNADGLRPRDWNAELVEQIEMDVQNGLAQDDACGFLLAYYLGINDVIRARAMVGRLAKTSDSDGIKFDHAFLVAIVDRDGKTARAILDTVTPKARGKTYQYWRAFASACDVAGDMQGARAAVQSARRVAARAKAPLDEDDRDLLDAIEKRASLPVAA